MIAVIYLSLHMKCTFIIIRKVRTVSVVVENHCELVNGLK